MGYRGQMLLLSVPRSDGCCFHMAGTVHNWHVYKSMISVALYDNKCIVIYVHCSLLDIFLPSNDHKCLPYRKPAAVSKYDMTFLRSYKNSKTQDCSCVTCRLSSDTLKSLQPSDTI